LLSSEGQCTKTSCLKQGVVVLSVVGDKNYHPMTLIFQ